MSKTKKLQHIAAAGLIAASAALAAPVPARAMELPGTCDLIKNTVCHVPGSVLESILRWLGL